MLLLDEPLGALDLKLREKMQEELKALQKSLGITFVFVTHDQGEALSMADRVAVFNDGRIMQVGTPQEIYERPRTRFVADFVGSSNVLPPDFVAAPSPAQRRWASLRPEAIRDRPAAGARRRRHASRRAATSAPTTRLGVDAEGARLHRRRARRPRPCRPKASRVALALAPSDAAPDGRAGMSAVGCIRSAGGHPAEQRRLAARCPTCSGAGRGCCCS